MAQKHIRFNDNLITDIKTMANEQNCTETQIINDALKHYRDFYYMQNKASIINNEILNITKSYMNTIEKNINFKTNKLLSEVAVQSAITNLIIADNLNVPTEQLRTYRQKAIDFIKNSNRILRLDELINE